jgi:hypothetical protein
LIEEEHSGNQSYLLLFMLYATLVYLRRRYDSVVFSLYKVDEGGSVISKQRKIPRNLGPSRLNIRDVEEHRQNCYTKHSQLCCHVQQLPRTILNEVGGVLFAGKMSYNRHMLKAYYIEEAENINFRSNTFSHVVGTVIP